MATGIGHPVTVKSDSITSTVMKAVAPMPIGDLYNSLKSHRDAIDHTLRMMNKDRKHLERQRRELNRIMRALLG